MKGFKISAFKGGDGTAISQIIQDTDKKTDLNGSVFTYRCHKKGYQDKRPTSLCVPIWNDDFIMDYQAALREAGLDSIYRNSKRCESRRGRWEIKIFFPHNFTANQAIQFLLDHYLAIYMPF
jgi:hypothetical protein